ncbi:hypothetical protein V8E53_015636 [Lactarius tabidus]
MDPSQTAPREHLRQAIDAEIKSLEGSIRTLKHRRNELAPISSLPTEVIDAIFSLLRVPSTSSPSSTLGGKLHCLAWLGVTQVCHHWREIALNQPLLWSHLDFTTVSSDGATKILARAKTVPLHLEAKVSPFDCWDDARFRYFRKELKAHVSHIRHLDLSMGPAQLNRTLNHLTLPAPTLEYLIISCQDEILDSQVSIPNTLFDGATPRLSCLELCDCAINWKSPLLRGLEHLDIHSSYPGPSLSNWLDALDEMPQLRTLTLDWASPVVNAPPPFNIERTITLPSLTLFDIDSQLRECGLALAHLILPSLITLCVKVISHVLDGSDLPEMLPYVTRHAYGLHHTQPLQSVFVRRDKERVEILAWTSPDIDLCAKLFDMDVESPNKIAIPHTMHSLQVAISGNLTPLNRTEVFDMLRAALPLDGIVTLAVEKRTRLNKQFWLRHAPQWPLLRCAQLGSPAASGLREMLLEDNDEGRERPLLPLLTKLVLSDTTFSAPRTLRLCDALMARAKQGVPLETLDLKRCLASRQAVMLLSEIMTGVLGPERYLEEQAQMRSRWDSTARGRFVANDSSGEEYTDSGNDGEETDDFDTWESDFIWSLMD